MNRKNTANRSLVESGGKTRIPRGHALVGTFCMMLGVLALMQAGAAGAVRGTQDQDKDGAGVVFSKQATSKEVGLPVYPGSKAHKDERDDSPSIQMGLWGSTFGFKLAVMKMESNDAPERVAEFYKKALAKYGTVLNCSDPSNRAGVKDKGGSSNKLECDDDKPEKGGLVFKAGTKEKQHVVGIQPNGQGSLFQLVYVEAHSDDKDKKAN